MRQKTPGTGKRRVQRKERIMLVLFFGIAALIGTVLLGRCCGDSWLHFWEGLGEVYHDDGRTFRT